MSKSTTSENTTTTNNISVEEEMTTETIDSVKEEMVNELDDIFAEENSVKIPRNAAFEAKQKFSVEYGKNNPTHLFGLLGEETVMNWDESTLDKILSRENLLDDADLENILIKSLGFKEVQRILSNNPVAVGYRAETLKELQIIAYVPINYTEEQIVEKLNS